MTPLEMKRLILTQSINSSPRTKEQLQKDYGVDNVWDTDELQETFFVHGFLAPFVIVTHRMTDEAGSILFQQCPRYYFGFEVDEP